MFEVDKATVEYKLECDVPRERIKAVSFLGVRKSHSHPGGERRVQDHSGTLVSGGQVHRRHRPDALPVQDYVLRADAVSDRSTEPQSTAGKQA